MATKFYPPRGIGFRAKTECEITGEHYGDVRRGYWTCCDEEDDQ